MFPNSVGAVWEDENIVHHVNLLAVTHLRRMYEIFIPRTRLLSNQELKAKIVHDLFTCEAV